MPDSTMRMSILTAGVSPRRRPRSPRKSCQCSLRRDGSQPEESYTERQEEGAPRLVPDHSRGGGVCDEREQGGEHTEHAREERRDLVCAVGLCLPLNIDFG